MDRSYDGRVIEVYNSDGTKVSGFKYINDIINSILILLKFK